MIFLYLVIAALLVILGVVLIRAAVLHKTEKIETERLIAAQANREDVCKHLSSAVQIATVSGCSRETFSQFRSFLEQAFPSVHSVMKRFVMEDDSMYYVWESGNTAELPGAFMAHMDVVPAGAESAWDEVPFSGTEKDGYLYGRGTIDMKGQLIAIFEAAEQLIKEGFSPKRDMYLIFGSDEEIANNVGAAKICDLLAQKGIRFSFVIDEGGMVRDGADFGIDQDIACIGICEKGYIDLELQAVSAGGHSSAPPSHTALGLVCKAASNLEKKPMPLRWNKAAKDMFAGLVSYMDFKQRLLYANRWLFGTFLLRNMAKDSAMAALFRTTCAVTMASGSEVSNSLPAKAAVTVNMRVAPGQTCKAALDHVQSCCPDGVKVHVLRQLEPSDISNTQDNIYRAIAGCLQNATGIRIITPFPVVVGTDCRSFHKISEHVYRILPFSSAKEDAKRMHAANERIQIDGLMTGVAFFEQVMKSI